ncbi:MAG: hypothetical protein MHMPM18_004479 [Marteilia pararefringens]
MSRQNNSSIEDDRKGSRSSNFYQSDSDKPGVKLFVAHIPESISRNGLRNIFEEYVNEIQDIKIIKGKKDPSEGDFGFVVVSSVRDAENAIRELDGKSVGDKKLLVKISNPPSSGSSNTSPFSNNQQKVNNCNNLGVIKTNDDDDYNELMINERNTSSSPNFEEIHRNQVNRFYDALDKKGPNESHNQESKCNKSPYDKEDTQKNDRISEINKSITIEKCSNLQCDKMGKLTCKTCNSASYCSSTCQVNDWVRHHALCMKILLSKAGIQDVDKIINQKQLPVKKALQVSSLSSYKKFEEKRLKCANIIITSKTDLNLWFIFENDSELFIELDTEINQYVSDNDRLFKLESVNPGNVVIAPFENSYHRAIVLNNVPDSHVRVFFMDFGNIDTIKCSELFYMPEDIANIPPFTYSFSPDMFAKFSNKFIPSNLQSSFALKKPIVLGNTLIELEDIEEIIS